MATIQAAAHIGDGLKDLRVERAVLRRELADKAGIEVNTVNKIEPDQAACTFTILKLARALGVEPRRLMKKEDDARSGGHGPDTALLYAYALRQDVSEADMPLPSGGEKKWHVTSIWTLAGATASSTLAADAPRENQQSGRTDSDAGGGDGGSGGSLVVSCSAADVAGRSRRIGGGTRPALAASTSATGHFDAASRCEEIAEPESATRAKRACSL